MTDYTDTLGRPVRVTVAPDGTTMFLDTVVGIDMAGKPITVSSLNDITGAALRDRQEFFERVCDAVAVLAKVADELDENNQFPDQLYKPVRELADIVWPAPKPEEKPEQVDAEKQAQ